LKTFEGYNGTIFAYGQTGSGKSFSMSGIGNGDLRGITPRVNEELFQKIAEQMQGTRRFLVMCSYFEIYNEIIFDLLNPVSDRSKLGAGLQIKEHPVLGIYVKDLTEIVAEDASKLEENLERGQKNRAMSSTMMNATSSRSHSIFTIKVHQHDEEDTTRNVFAKLNLVDLAGSERQKGTGATGQTLKEGANINKSLSALGNVINALVESANGKKVFIPYRNSKLTRVLQESLGGNSLCTMLAALSPAACNYEETLSTLRYANRAKAIKVSATKNEEASQISRLKAEVDELKKKLENAGTGGSAGLTQAERMSEQKKFEQRLKEMETMMSTSWQDKAKLSEENMAKMKKLEEERRRAAEKLEEDRAKRIRLLQEKNNLELTIRGFIDFIQHLPKFAKELPMFTGEQPRQWLKMQRMLKEKIEELKESKQNLLAILQG
jgi:kinesin family protein 1/kinesin family protein 3/17